MIGQFIAGYQILDEIGAGGMGVVFRARDTRLKRLVAIKRLSPAPVDRAERRQRFLHEAQAASALNHPGIVTIHDVVRHGTDDLIVMELVEGESLARFIPPDGLHWQEAAQLALELSLALAAAHAAGVVHRDLKPANVMVNPGSSRSNLGNRLKVLDFGIAKRMPDADLEISALRLTDEGMQPGTPSYMAPEQLLGEAVDPRTDIFCFGLLLYEMLTGQRPFQGNTPIALADHLLHGAPAAIAASQPDVPRALSKLVDWTLAKLPADRPQNMNQVVPALRAICSPGQDTSTAPSMATGTTLKTLVAAYYAEATQLPDAETFDVPSRDISTLLRQLLAQYRGSRIKTRGGPLLLFELPRDALRFAMAFHRTIGGEASHAATGDAPSVVAIETRVGIHIGEVTAGPTAVGASDSFADGSSAQDQGQIEVGEADQLAVRKLARLAGRRQTLLTGPAFDLARRTESLETGSETLHWLAHGDYQFADDVLLEVFEVGAHGFAPLEPPSTSTTAQRAPSRGQILGWRPAPGLSVPSRDHWLIERKLSTGGFGEVWLARHAKTHEPRVFKFCYETERLRSLQREITVFRLLKEELGERQDIARILDWNLQQPPYFIESAFTDGGSLVDWSAVGDGLGKVPLPDRLALVAQVATALEAAHSVGVLHKDIKPANVLIRLPSAEESARAVLADFGIGLILDRQRLQDRGITILGLTAGTADDHSSLAAGTHLYMAPELLMGRPPSIQSDIYALGVLLYQVAVADLERPLAAGWERDIADSLLCQDIADCVDGQAGNRPRSALEVAERLRSLEARRLARQVELRAVEEAREAELEAVQRARRTAQRRRLLIATTTISTLVLIVVSLFAWQASRAKADAEHGRAQAERLIDVLMGDLHESLEKIGRLDLLAQAARGSQTYFDGLDSHQESNEATVKRGVTLLNIGDVLTQQGDTEAARQAFDRAQGLFSVAAASHPDSFEVHDAKRRSQIKFANTLSRQGDTRAALESAQEALAETTRLAAQHPDDMRWQNGAAECHYWICVFEDQAGNRPQALDACRAAIATLDNKEPESVPWRQALLTLKSRILVGGILRVLKRGDEAFAEYGRARHLAERLNRHDPANTNWSQKLAWIHFQTGVLRLFEQRDPEAAFADLSAARNEYERLSQIDPMQSRWHENLAKTLNFIGRIELQRNNSHAAIAHFTRATEILEGLVARDPSRHSRLGVLARLHQSMGRAHLQGHEVDAAIASFAAAVDLNSRWTEVAGDDPDPLNFLSWSHVVLGDGYAQQGNHQRARAEWQRAVALIEPITEASNAIEYRDTHVQALLKLGRLSEARPMVQALLADGWQDSSFLAAVRQAGLEAQIPETEQ